MKIKVTTLGRGFLDGLSISGSSCAPHTPIQVQISETDSNDRLWKSEATFFASNGCFDTATSTAWPGTYSGCDAHGLLWSMVPEDGLGVMFYAPKIANRELAIEVVQGENRFSTRLHEATSQADIQRIEISEEEVEGVCYLPKTPKAGVIVLAGSGGGTSDELAHAFAQAGYAAFALAYFSYGSRPRSLMNIPLETFEAGRKWFQNLPQLKNKKIAVQGGSRGAEAALLYACYFNEGVSAVIARAPGAYSGIAYLSLEDRKQFTNGPYPSWTYKGEPLPYPTRYVSQKRVYPRNKEDGIILLPFFVEELAALHDSQDERRIPIQNLHAPCLLIAGDDDAMWPARAYADELMLSDKRNRFQLASYPACGHWIPLPGVPTFGLNSKHPVDKNFYAYGGSPQGVAFAARESWKTMLSFLQTHCEA